MEKIIKEYSEALKENLSATQDEIQAKDKKKKAYYRLMRAKDALRAMETDLLSKIELI